METARSVKGSDWFASMDATHGHLTAEEMTPQATQASFAAAAAATGSPPADRPLSGSSGYGTAAAVAPPAAGHLRPDGVIDIRVDAHRGSADGEVCSLGSTPSSIQVPTPLRNTLVATTAKTLRRRTSQSGGNTRVNSKGDTMVRISGLGDEPDWWAATAARTASGMPQPTIAHKWNWWACAAYACMWAALVFYFFVRLRYTVPVNYAGYSYFILAFELIGSSNTVLQGLYLLRRKEYQYVPNVTGQLPLSRPFHVRVMLPCYRESLELIQVTAYATIRAELPAGCHRTVYICDDGKDPAKKAWVLDVNSPELVYVSGRTRPVGEINGKSGNLNNALNLIYPPGVEIPLDEVVAVFDADQVAREGFFVRTLQWMQDDKTTIVLTPQYFHNFNPKADIWNHKSSAYWDVILPGQDGFNTVCCTGSNFLLRSKHAAEVGWFPTFTMGEDVALALELQCKGHSSCYLHECLAVGEVPTSIRAICMQKSRWCKGGMQICFNRRKCPMLRRELPLFQRLLWATGYWGYFSNCFCTPVFYLVPVIGICFNIFPVNNSLYFALAFTIYIVMIQVISFWAPSFSTQRALWFSSVANTNLWFTFAKAIYSVLKGKFMNRPAVFKATPKSAGGKAAKKAKAPSAFKDLWMQTLMLTILVCAFLIGIWRLVIDGILRSTWNYSLIVSLLWCVYNAVPPYLMLQYAAFKEHGLQEVCRVASAVTFIAGAGVIAIIWWLRPEVYDYKHILNDSLLFFESHRVGPLPADNRIPWRGGSFFSDYAPGGISLVGGYMDFGDSFVKYSYPIASTVALLAWSLVDYGGGYQKAGQQQDVRDAIQWGADYLVKAHTGTNSFVAQVCNTDIDGQMWTRPEQVKEFRPVYTMTTAQPGADVAAAAAAALAATAIAFQGDPIARTYQSHATQLYQFAVANPGLHAKWIVSTAGNIITPYNSHSYFDDLAYAAFWLYRLTGDGTYLTAARSYYNSHVSAYPTAGTPAYIYNWENSGPAVAMLLAKATDFKVPTYTADVEAFLHIWLQESAQVQYTPHLLAWTAGGFPLQNAANAAWLARLWSDRSRASRKYACWGESQLRYILGMRNKDHSYIVGTGSDPKRPGDRAASCPANFNVTCNSLNALWTSAPNPHPLTGAVVAGPDINDKYEDVRANANSRVCLNNNAAFTAALAGMLELNDDHWAQCVATPIVFWATNRKPVS